MDDIQRGLFDDAAAFRDERTHEVGSLEELRSAVEAGGFAIGAWCADDDCEAKVKAETKATIRFLPLEQEDPGAACTVCGKPGVERATWAIAY
jgi:prolyl-tRNA synthetase